MFQFKKRKNLGGRKQSIYSILFFLRSRPSQTPNLFMRPHCLWDKGPPPRRDLIGFEPVTSKEQPHVLNH
jgi:hypothetical protein